MQGMKFDNDKLRYDLFPSEALEEITKVLTYGAKKYDDNNWRLLEGWKDRYYAACLRHLIAYRKGQEMDEESELMHLSHAACCLVFMITKEIDELSSTRGIKIK